MVTSSNGVAGFMPAAVPLGTTQQLPDSSTEGQLQLNALELSGADTKNDPRPPILGESDQIAPDSAADRYDLAEKASANGGTTMKDERKWLIPPRSVLTHEERKKRWEQIHEAGSYEDVFSMTEDAQFVDQIVKALNNIGGIRSVLIPGCGSRVSLQCALADVATIDEICCTDFERVVRIAEEQFKHPKVKYLARNSANLGFGDRWDAIIIVASVLSESDDENRDILRSCYNALRRGGSLIGFFPTIFCALDLATLDPSLGLAKYIDLHRSSLYEPKQDMHQIFYTPLRLRRILIEARFHLNKMEVYFCDSDFLVKQGSACYGLADEDMVIYGMFVSALK